MEVAGVLPISDCGSSSRDSCRQDAWRGGPLNRKQAVAIGASCSKALIQRTQTENKLMALTKFGFIGTGDRFVQHQGTDKFQMKVVGVATAAEGIKVAQEMVREGVQFVELIELCGGFSPVWAGKIIEAIDSAVPVGVVAYGPESIDSMHRLFSY